MRPPSWRAAPLVALVALLAGCAAPPPALVVGADPSDPSARVARLRHRASLGTEPSRRPVAPRAWNEQSERVTPRPRTGE
jgi:hypothetical protein